MADTIKEFFRGYWIAGQPLLWKVLRTVRFDLVDGKETVDHWLVTVEPSDLAISQQQS